MHDVIPLRNLSVGQSAKIGLVTGPIDQVQRLKELGLQDGTQVEMVCQGTPCIIRLDGSRLCFRDNEMLNVFVHCEDVV